MRVSWIRHGTLVALGLSIVAAPGARAAPHAYPPSIRRPRGIYAVVVLDKAAGAAQDLHALLTNPAVSGLAVRMFWSSLQPAKDRYDFSAIDAAFAAATASHKTVQLVLVPGFGTPSWVLDELTSCDTLHANASAGTHAATSKGAHAGAHAKHEGHEARQAHEAHTGHGKKKEAAAEPSGPTEQASAPCGKQTFEVSEGKRHGEQQQLPLPWSPIYKRDWRTFVTAIAARYGPNEAFVSIAVTGPTAESAEIIMPRTGDQLERWAELLELSYHDASYHRTDKAFIDEWEAAVTMFGEVFRNVTLVLTRGSGLLNFTKGQNEAAQAAILAAFGRQSVGSNAKATQTSGLKACRENAGGIKGVREMAADRSLSPPVLGGAQFDTSFSTKPAAEGCPSSCDADAPACRSLTPRDALANVLANYFDGTPEGGDFAASRGAAELNYLQVYAPDFVYAGTQPAAQALFDRASQSLARQAR